MKKFTVDESRMLLTALEHMKDEFANAADKCKKDNSFLSEKYYKERSNAYKQLFYKVAEMMDDITE